MLSLPSRYSQRKSSPADGWKTFLKTLFLNQRSFQAVHDDVHHLGNKNYRQSLRSTVELLEVIPFLGHFPSCVQPGFARDALPTNVQFKVEEMNSAQMEPTWQRNAGFVFTNELWVCCWIKPALRDKRNYGKDSTE